MRQQMGRVLASFPPGLFAGGDAADLPPDNLDLVRWIRNPQSHECRVHGHRHASVRIVLAHIAHCVLAGFRGSGFRGSGLVGLLGCWGCWVVGFWSGDVVWWWFSLGL